MIDFLRKFNWLFPQLVLFTLVLGTFGFHQHAIMHDNPIDWLSSLYLSLQLFVMNSGGVAGPIPMTLEISRFLAPSLTAGGIFIALWEPLNQNYVLFRIRFWKDHIVVCGLSKKAELLILDHLKHKTDKVNIVVIEPNTEHGSISYMRKRGVVILEGNAIDEDMLHKANILKARVLLALTNDEKINIHVAQKATHIYNQFPAELLPNNILQVVLHIDDFYTMNIFKEFHEKAIPENIEFRKGGSKMDYHVFSIYQLAAIHMIDNYCPDKYVSLATNDDPPAHLLIMGDNLATQYLILEAAQMYHFANLKKTRITVVADDIKEISSKINSLYPFLEKTVEVRYINKEDFFVDPCPVPCDDISVCFVALDDDGKSVYYSRKLRQHLFSQGRNSMESSLRSYNRYADFEKSTPPIKALLPRNTALVNIFKDVAFEMKALNIELINMDDEVCNKKTIVDNRKEEDFIAKHIHYEWAKSQAAKNKTKLGSMQDEWDLIKDSQKDSNRLPARHLFIKLRFVHADLSDQTTGEELDFDSLEPEVWDRIARMEHNRWNAEKYINGFVQIEGVNDKNLGNFLKGNLKCHWDLVPFDDLSKETQDYDKFTFRMAPVIAHLNKKRILKREM
ncbi:MAG: NAD-binding protein [Saprospiraceae bacterium]|nr:NAD-binding protein [Candidatus Opimibacter iunctus]